MTKIIHPFAGVVALLTIATFWLTTLGTELFGSPMQITAVKTAIPWGMLLLIPAMAAVGGTGFTRAGGRRGGVLGTKARRMPIIAVNAVLVLIPAALYLASKARAGEFDTAFYAVQALELTAGSVNLALLGMSMRDGLRITGRLSKRGNPS
ncbi:MAG: hypothetical protein QNJ05_15715 [Woeseiaceae bacterium]|nr:hypothetical protein [Woeseiaceae bacterium]